MVAVANGGGRYSGGGGGSRHSRRTCSGTGSARRAAAPPPPPPALLEEVERLLCSCDSWQFDTFNLQEVSGGHALSVLGFYLLQREGLLERFRAEPLRMARLLRTLEAGYPATNPYHNSAHAADVLHTLHVLLHGARLTEHYLDELGLMAAYFAAIVHDYGHPGLTNDFLVATSHPLALRYNDRAPLESHHAAAAFTLLADRPDLDVTAGLIAAERAAFRKQVLELVLATDMKQHFAVLNQFNTVHRLAGKVDSGSGSGGVGGSATFNGKGDNGNAAAAAGSA
ncbi:3'5'-cyclic nucleotide phosphodiesterase, partial [Volvox carteri f. nagariensis]